MIFKIKIPLKSLHVPLESHYVFFFFFALVQNKLLNIKSNWDLLLNNVKGENQMFFM